jgi:hypothetical protein
MTAGAALPDLQRLNPDELRALIISQHEMLVALTMRDTDHLLENFRNGIHSRA